MWMHLPLINQRTLHAPDREALHKLARTVNPAGYALRIASGNTQAQYTLDPSDILPVHDAGAVIATVIAAGEVLYLDTATLRNLMTEGEFVDWQNDIADGGGTTRGIPGGRLRVAGKSGARDWGGVSEPGDGRGYANWVIGLGSGNGKARREALKALAARLGVANHTRFAQMLAEGLFSLQPNPEPLAALAAKTGQDPEALWAAIAEGEESVPELV